MLKNLINKFASLKHALINREQYKTWVPPGHYYSPIASLSEVRSNEERIFGIIEEEIPGVDLWEAEQLDLLNHFRKYYAELPFGSYKQENLRYCFENPSYSYSDAIFLYCMMRHIRPKKIVEVGSGYSSCVILDTNELFFGNEISCTFIDPYPQLLLSLIKNSDKDRIEILQKRLQDIEVEKFCMLSAGDMVIIDSTHVSKVDSDVNYIFFKLLPHTNRGIYVHFHDVFYPFEYPKEWIYEGRAFNEDYMLRAFLQYNKAFKVVLFNHFMELFHRDKFLKEMPLCLKNCGGSIWIKRIE